LYILMATETSRFKWASSDRYELLRGFARENRNKLTPAELFLWEHLRQEQLGVNFRRQHVIYDYIVDFVCLDKMLVIEVDGAYHAEREQMEDDAVRTAHLEQIGFRVLRFNNEEVMFDIDKVLEKIGNELKG